MKADEMNSMQRVLTTLTHKEPDRVPLFLLLTMHGAKELGMSLKEYFSKAENVVRGQKIMREKYSNDLYYPFFYAPIETEAFGGEVIYIEDGPPNSGAPLIRDPEDIMKLEPPNVSTSRVLSKVLEATEALAKEAKSEVPIIGVVISPFSLPVMQLGFDKYIELMFFRPDLFERLMKVNEAFCVDWANAQLRAGATAICYFDPISSTTIVTREQYLKTGFQIAKRTIAQINGPTATHFASGKCMEIIDDVAQTGTAIACVSTEENIGEVKNKCRGKLSVLGNLNGIEMARWTESEACEKVSNVIASAAPGGGFILADNHGEIPYQVSENVLLAIADCVKEYGRYPIVGQKDSHING